MVYYLVERIIEDKIFKIINSIEKTKTRSLIYQKYINYAFNHAYYITSQYVENIEYTKDEKDNIFTNGSIQKEGINVLLLFINNVYNYFSIKYNLLNN